MQEAVWRLSAYLIRIVVCRILVSDLVPIETYLHIPVRLENLENKVVMYLCVQPDPKQLGNIAGPFPGQ